MTKPSNKDDGREQQAMPFNEALKRVWVAPPMPKVKPKPEQKMATTKPAK